MPYQYRHHRAGARCNQDPQMPSQSQPVFQFERVSAAIHSI